MLSSRNKEQGIYYFIVAFLSLLAAEYRTELAIMEVLRHPKVELRFFEHAVHAEWERLLF